MSEVGLVQLATACYKSKNKLEEFIFTNNHMKVKTDFFRTLLFVQDLKEVDFSSEVVRTKEEVYMMQTLCCLKLMEPFMEIPVVRDGEVVWLLRII